MWIWFDLMMSTKSVYQFLRLGATHHLGDDPFFAMVLRFVPSVLPREEEVVAIPVAYVRWRINNNSLHSSCFLLSWALRCWWHAWRWCSHGFLGLAFGPFSTMVKPSFQHLRTGFHRHRVSTFELPINHSFYHRPNLKFISACKFQSQTQCDESMR